jgi:flagellar FliJ protein
MNRLGHAASIQNGVVGDQSARVQAAQRALLDAELRLASLRKVVEKRLNDLALQRQRRDQKQTDERAALQYRNTGQEN